MHQDRKDRRKQRMYEKTNEKQMDQNKNQFLWENCKKLNEMGFTCSKSQMKANTNRIKWD